MPKAKDILGDAIKLSMAACKQADKLGYNSGFIGMNHQTINGMESLVISFAIAEPTPKPHIKKIKFGRPDRSSVQTPSSSSVR